VSRRGGETQNQHFQGKGTTDLKSERGGGGGGASSPNKEKFLADRKTAHGENAKACTKKRPRQGGDPKQKNEKRKEQKKAQTQKCLKHKRGQGPTIREKEGIKGHKNSTLFWAFDRGGRGCKEKIIRILRGNRNLPEICLPKLKKIL